MKIFWVDFDQFYAGWKFDERASDVQDDDGLKIVSGDREKINTSVA